MNHADVPTLAAEGHGAPPAEETPRQRPNEVDPEQQPDVEERTNPETVVVGSLQCSAGPEKSVSMKQKNTGSSCSFLLARMIKSRGGWRIMSELYEAKLRLAQVLKRWQNHNNNHNRGEEMANRAEKEVVVAHAYNKTEAQQDSTIRARPTTQRRRRKMESRKRRS